MTSGRGGFITACILSILVWGQNFIWLSLDTRPPVWDMALHQTYALNYILQDGSSDGRVLEPWEKSGDYPPFVHLVIALLFWIFRPDPHVAAYANIPATFILFWAACELASERAGPRAGRWACLLTALTPYLVWFSRETVLDYWLSAWFALALVLLRKTQGFESRRWSLVLGAVLALGLLTKWFFAAFMLTPIGYIAVESKIWKNTARMTHFISALAVAALVAGLWYIPNLPRLVRYVRRNAEIGALEGEPPVLSFQSFIYYLRLLEGCQLFLLLFVILCLACLWTWRHKLMSDGRFLVFSIIGVWIVVTLFRTKDPRFTMPVLAPLSVISAAWIQSWKKTFANKIIQGTIVVLLCVQLYAINFGVSGLPERIMLLRGYQGSFDWDWNLYQQSYFGILGKPVREDWKLDEILGAIGRDAERRDAAPTLALIPDLPRFNSANFNLYARIRGVKVRAFHLKSGFRGIHSFDGYNYVVATRLDQGISWTTTESGALNRIIEDSPGNFRMIGQYAIPNGDTARLYSIERGG